MRKKLFILLSIAAFVGATMVSCKTPQNGKTKGRQQPTKGRMPCPQKDC